MVSTTYPPDRPHDYLDLDLRQEPHGIFRATIDVGVALLPPVTLHLRDGHAVHADLRESREPRRA